MTCRSGNSDAEIKAQFKGYQPAKGMDPAGCEPSTMDEGMNPPSGGSNVKKPCGVSMNYALCGEGHMVEGVDTDTGVGFLPDGQCRLEEPIEALVERLDAASQRVGRLEIHLQNAHADELKLKRMQEESDASVKELKQRIIASFR